MLIALLCAVWLESCASLRACSDWGQPMRRPLSTLEPAVTIVPAALFLGDAIEPVLQLLGGAVILCAVVVLARARAVRRLA